MNKVEKINYNKIFDKVMNMIQYFDATNILLGTVPCKNVQKALQIILDDLYTINVKDKYYD